MRILGAINSKLKFIGNVIVPKIPVILRVTTENVVGPSNTIQASKVITYRDRQYAYVNYKLNVYNQELTIENNNPTITPVLVNLTPDTGTLVGNTYSNNVGQDIDLLTVIDRHPQNRIGLAVNGVISYTRDIYLHSMIVYDQVTYSFINGSLCKHIGDFAASITTGKTGLYPENPVTHTKIRGPDLGNGTVQSIYNDTDHRTVFTRNPTHILKDVNITGINAPYSHTRAEIGAVYPDFLTNPNAYMGECATLISPRHVYGASHWHPLDNLVVKFVAEDNTIHTRTIIRSTNIPITDIWIGYLDSDLPATIKPLKILPKNIANYISGHRVPTYLSYLSNIMIGSSTILGQGINPFIYPSWDNIPLDPKDIYNYLKDWYSGGLYGSGSPVFTVINNEAVLLMTLWVGNSGGDYGATPAYTYIDAINEAMTLLNQTDTQYQLTLVSLTGFNTY